MLIFNVSPHEYMGFVCYKAFGGYQRSKIYCGKFIETVIFWFPLKLGFRTWILSVVASEPL